MTRCFVGYFKSAIRGQAVHNLNVFRRRFNKFCINLKTFEGFNPLFLLVLLPHTDPGIGVNHISISDRFFRIFYLRNSMGCYFISRGIDSLSSS